MKSVLMFVALVLAAPVAAQTPVPPSDRPVVVTAGEAVVKRAPDRAWVTVSAESRAKAPREAQRANAEAMTAVTSKLKAAGLAADAIRTIGYDVQPEFDFNNGRQTLRGYVARNTIEVRIDDLNRVGEVVDIAVGSGATSVGGVRFDLKDRETAEREALRMAVADAKARAEAAAAGAGARIDAVIRIEEQRTMIGPEPRPAMMAMRAGGAEMKETPITAGDIEIRANVTLTATIK
ncbi:MAG TPA: SIMPL domain-containing protein [Vicinamibacterales bacterium]